MTADELEVVRADARRRGCNCQPTIRPTTVGWTVTHQPGCAVRAAGCTCNPPPSKPHRRTCPLHQPKGQP